VTSNPSKLGQHSDYPKRGQIYWVRFDPAVGSEVQKSPRPALVISCDAANKRSNLLIVAPITSKKVSRVYSFEVYTEATGIPAKILLDHMRSIDKIRLGDLIGTIDNATMEQVGQAAKLMLELE
jgi:mRNA interferase MazF